MGAGRDAYAGNAYTKNNYADAVKTRTKWRYCEAIGIQMLFMNDCFDKFEMDQVSGKQLIWNTSYILAYEFEVMEEEVDNKEEISQMETDEKE